MPSPHRHVTTERTRSFTPSSVAFLLATLLLATLARQAHRIFVRALAKSAFHPPCEADRRFPKLVAQAIRSRQGLLPTLLPRRLQQVKLGATRFEIRRLHSQQSHRRAWLPVIEKQTPRLLKNLVIHLRRLLQRMRSRDGREIFVAQFQLEGARKVSALAQPHQRRLQALGVAGVLVERVLVADRFGIDAFSHRVVEPSTRILAPRLP